MLVSLKPMRVKAKAQEFEGENSGVRRNASVCMA